MYLIGDAGYATPESPVIRQLRADIVERSAVAEVTVLFLGDNIYPEGLHDPSDPDYETDVSRLEAQIDIVRGTAASAVFVPGNHDWNDTKPGGLAAIRRQGVYIDSVARTGVPVALLPQNGCPGPVARELGEGLLLVFLDTVWWLTAESERGQEGCLHAGEAAVLEGLRLLLTQNERGERRRVIVAAHHPLDSYGPHGGYFGVQDMFFPATRLWAPLYIPIPFLYPMVRNSGVTVQDQSNPTNLRMRRALGSVFADFPREPVVFAGGHDHTLQVFEGEEYSVGYILVSGAGSQLDDVGKADAEFAAGRQERELGYMRIELFADGTMLLSVITDGTQACEGAPATCVGSPTVRFWRWLTEAVPSS